MRFWELEVEDGSHEAVVGVSVALQSQGCRGVRGVPRLLHPQGAAPAGCAAFWLSPFQLGKIVVAWFFAGLSEEGFSWSFVPLPNVPAPFGKGTAGPGEALPGKQGGNCTGNHSC